MVFKPDNQVQLKNGCKLSYAEYGDPEGKPVLHFHGMPSSRFEGCNPANDEIAARRGVRIMVVERPGYGRSDFFTYTITSWPDIVSGFADAMGMERIAVLGVSSGGKYAAACAWKIAARLEAAGIVSGNCPYHLPGARQTFSKMDRQLYWIADKASWVLQLGLKKIATDARQDPAGILSIFPDLSEADKSAMARPEGQQEFGRMILGAFEHGPRGVARDWQLEARPWGFPLQDISIPVHIWHGEQDTIVPVAQGHLMAESIPHSQTRFFPHDGHLTMFTNHFEEILLDLLPGGR